MTAIIWGAGGQDGYYLKILLEKEGINVIGIGKSNSFLQVDLTSYEEVCNVIKQYNPDYIFHLAASSTSHHYAWKENYDAISTGSINILQAVKQFAPECRVFLSGSGLQFVNNGEPIKETDPFDAKSIYSVCRISSVYLARYYRSIGINVFTGFFFHHDSPLRSERHINKIIISTAKRIAQGSNEKLELGDMSVKKEFGFAGDIVRAVWQLVQQQEVKECVIGTGKAHSIEEWVEICFSLYNLNWKNHVVKTDGFVPEYKILVSDPSTIFSLNWRPQVLINDLAKLMFEG